MTSSERPQPARPVEAATDPLDERLAGADGLLVGLDFDGTLAPIVDDPSAPTIQPPVAEQVRGLVSHSDATVAVVSGRELADLEERVGVDGVVYAGNHGLELRRDGERVVVPAADERLPVVRRARERVGDAVADVPGAAIEDKGVTFTLHVRETPDERVDEARAAVADVADANDELAVVSGKETFEVRPAVDRDKGSVMRSLARETPAGWRTLYLGDDTTDEDAFRAIRPDGVGVVVGPREGTAAAYRLPAQADVAPFLAWLRADVLGAPDGTAD